METIIAIIIAPLALYLSIAGLYQLVLALAAQTADKEAFQGKVKQNKFLILVPAYKEDAVILKSSQHNLALKYQYPTDLFDYMVVSDQLTDDTNQNLKQLGAKVCEVNFEKSTKVKSLKAAFSTAKSDYDAVVILDADNTVPANFLHKANQYLNQGYSAIQGQRTAANSESMIACLDGFSETANNAMLCKGANRLGFSSKLSGSGMVFDYQLFEQVLEELTAIGGFDKEMELALTAQQVFIKYAEDLLIADEKVSSFESYQKQRGRWLESQYSFLKKSLKPAWYSLLDGNTDHFHKTWQLALPPRALAPFGLMLLAVISFWSSPVLCMLSVSGLVANIVSYFLTIPKGPLFRQSWKITLALPALFWSTLKALTWMKRSKTEFLHTPHQLVQS